MSLTEPNDALNETVLTFWEMYLLLPNKKTETGSVFFYYD